jgi:capsid assembly protease
MTTLARIADLVLNQPLLLTPEKAEVVAGVLAGRIGIDGPDLSRFEGSPVLIEADGSRRFRPFNVTNGVGVITITGSLVNRGAWIGAYSGLTSYEGIQHQLKQADKANDVRAIVLDIHTPGGEAVGAFETAAMVREIAARKPVIALVNGMAASAGYLIASGATEIVSTPSGVSGSIGVVSLHVDASGQLEQDGLKPTLIIAGAHKADGHPFGPLPESVRADWQARIDGIYSDFINAVAAGRGKRMSADAARATEARIYIGAKAVEVGLADRIGTFESVLADLTRAPGRSSSQKGKSMSENNGAPAAESNAGLTQVDLDRVKAEAKTEAKNEFEASLKADRERMAALDGLIAKVGGNAEGLKIIADAKVSGASAGDTALALVNAGVFAKAAVLGAVVADDASATGAKPAGQSDKAEVPQTPEGWKAEWGGSDALKADFVSAEDYVAFKKREARK